MTSPVSSDPTVLSSARWFWWIAGLSLVNLFLFHSGSNTSFVVGLGMTALASAVFSKAAGIVLSALIIGHYGVIGYFAQREKLWAFYIGLGVYLVDALIYLYVEDWMPVVFHAYVIFHLFRGIASLRGRSGAVAAPVVEQPQTPEAGA